MKIIPVLLALLLVNIPAAFPQINHQLQQKPSLDNSTGTSGTGANIDIKYHQLYWRINPDSTKYIKGYVRTNFLTIQNNVSSISFDLNDILIVDSVRFHQAVLPAANISRAGNILTINLGTTLSIGTLDSLWVYYQGVPPAASGARQGYQKGNDPNAGSYIMTLSESYEDRDWWPCKADMQDKIDSMDVQVNVPWVAATPDTFWVASNGILVDSAITGNSRTFNYKSRYPIASYLVFVSVARYNRYYPAPVNINGTNVQVVYDLLAGKQQTDYDAIVTTMNKINVVLAAFSDKYGDYPFKREKHGFYDGLIGAGGMEHQTFSGIASGALQSTRTLSHELMHQWFGDNVTFSTWNDLWLAEGFANYSECLAAELVPSLGLNPLSIRTGIKNSALGYTSTGVWIPNSNSTNSTDIWSSNYGGTVYVRGAMVVSMLRTLSGDAKYFQATTDYQQTLAGKSATADSLKKFFNRALGQDLTPFFNDYVGGSGSAATAVGGIGNPIYSIGWGNPSGNEFTVSILNQVQTAFSNVSYFRGPVALHIKGNLASQDTSLVFFDWGNGNLSYAGNGLGNPIAGNLLTYTLSFIPVTVLYDDSSKTLSTGTATKVGVVGIGQITGFSGRAVGNSNQINLSVLSDEPIVKVMAYKSTDGIHFSLAGKMDLAHLTNQQYAFTLADHSPNSPATFYRAVIYYADKQEITRDIAVTRSAELANNSLIIKPNPAKNRATIGFTNSSGIMTTISLLAEDGKKIGTYKTTGENINVDVSKLAAGIYIVQVSQSGKIKTKGKLVVTR